MSEAGPAPKRRKATLACEACRVRKSRCDGNKPQCSNCSQRNERCVYKIANAQLSEANDYIDSLVARIAELEGQVRQQQSDLSAAHTQTLGPLASEATDRTNEAATGGGKPGLDERRAITFAVSHTQSDPTLTVTTPTVLIDTSSPVDGMGGTTNGPGSSDIGEKFYGVSSSMAFMKQFYQINSRDHASFSSTRIERKTGGRGAKASRDTVTLSPRSFLGGPEGQSLMPRPVSDHFLDLYWDRVYHIYPFLHRATFMVAYEQLWTPASAHSTPQRPRLGLGGSDKCGFSSAVFHCALNAMLVLGVQFSDLPSEQKHSLATTLTQRAKSQFDLEMFEDGGLHVVQTLLLLSQIFQFTSYPTRCWSTIGGACRLAQGLGLQHIDKRRQGELEPVEIELRKRIWHSCLMLETIVSMTLGRCPTLGYECRVTLPSATDDAYLEHNLPQPPGTVSSMAFFIEAIKLCTILSKILSQIYQGNESDKPDTLSGYGSFDQLLGLDTDLCRFAEQMPTVLSWLGEQPETDQRNAQLFQQAHILRSRYLHLKILLYRPSFTQFCKTSASPTQLVSARANHDIMPEFPSLTESFAQCCSIECVRSAIELIEQTEQTATRDDFGAWWYSMFYLRTSAVVIFLADSCALVRDAIGSATLSASWQKCRNVLTTQLPQGALVRTCLQALDEMHEHVLKIRATTDQRNSRVADETAHRDRRSACGDEQQPASAEQIGISALLDGIDFNFDAYQFDAYGSIFSDTAYNFAGDEYGMPLF